jgi:hypothetical protein
VLSLLVPKGSKEDSIIDRVMRPAEGAARLVCLLLLAAVAAGHAGVQPLARIAIHRARFALDASAAVRASPELLGTKVRSYTCLSAALNNDAFDSFFRPPTSRSACLELCMHYSSMCRPSSACWKKNGILFALRRQKRERT